MELVSLTGGLMPAGKPAFLEVVKYPMIRDLVEQNGKKTMLKVIFLLVKDFCNSINVVRNMNEDQMIEAGAMLIDECDNFRLEDYTMMFALGKRGNLVKVYDRIDISIITQMMDEYWRRRYEAGKKLQEEELLEDLGPSVRLIDNVNLQDIKLQKAADNLSGVFNELKEKLSEWRNVAK